MSKTEYSRRSKATHTEFKYCFQVARARFRNHRHALTNKHVSMALRLKFFDAVLSLSVLFGLHTLLMTHKHSHTQLMPCSGVCFATLNVRLGHHHWATTMKRMKQRMMMARGNTHAPCRRMDVPVGWTSAPVRAANSAISKMGCCCCRMVS